MRFLTSVVCVFFFLGSYGNDSLDFVFPVDHQIRLSGNFMELRDNHFHAGIDIKSTKGVTGDRIKSVGEGYVSRIRITSGSYGNALYIDHPNGYTSVYAHLENFIPRIEDYLTDIQYEMESFEVDVYLPDSLLMVGKGEKIGTMGNTGRSFGPHLHFELRDTKTERPVNPEELGIGPSDNKAPVLQSLCIYNLDEKMDVYGTDIKYFNPKSAKYNLYHPTVEVESSFVGLGMQMYDSMDGSSNKNGVYSYELLVDDSLHFAWKADVFSFGESKKINGFIDYERKKKYAQKIYLLYKQECNNFSFYNSDENGIIQLREGEEKKVQILIKDIKGNISESSFVLKRKPEENIQGEAASFDCWEKYNRDEGIFRIEFDKETFFSSQKIDFETGKKNVLNRNCHFLTIGNQNIPVSKYYTISCPIPKDYNQQWTIMSVDSKGRYKDFGADTLDNRLYSRVDQLGEFYVYKDKSAPTVEVINLQKEMQRPWKLRIKDNLVPDGRMEDIYYEARVDGKWINMQYDLKNDLLVFDDFDRLPIDPAQLTLLLRDNCGNEKVFRRDIK